MKTKILISVTLLLILIFGVASCSDNDFESIGRYDGPSPENVRITHVNPTTGLDYTEEELAALDYDPSKEEYYMVDQPVDLAVIGSPQPNRIEVKKGDGTLLETITVFVPVEDEFKSADYSTTVTELGLEEGEKTSIKFESYYTSGETWEVVLLDFEVNYIGAPTVGPTGAELVRQSGDNIDINLDTNTPRDLQTFDGNRLGYSYDGSSEFATIDDDGVLDFRYTDDFSISFWVRTTFQGGGDPSIFADQDWGSSSNPGFNIAYNGGNIESIFGDGVGGKSYIETVDNGGAPINDGVWHLIAVTYNRAGDQIFYQDGVEVMRGNISGFASIESGNPIRLAQDGTGNYGDHFEGDLADAKVYDHLLTAEEIAEMAKEPAFAVTLKKLSGETMILNVEGTDVDEELFENNQKGFDFDGTSQYATILDEGALDFRFENNFSISFWVQTAFQGGGDPSIVADQDWGSSSNPGFNIAYNGGNVESIYGDGIGGKSYEESVDNGGSPINDGSWHLLTVTYDRAGLQIFYMDGIEVMTGNIAGFASISSGNPIRLAQDGTGAYGDFFTGKIAGVIIFDYALSADEVQDIYNK